MVADAVIVALEVTLLNNPGTDGFTLKLGSFGKFSVRHKPGIRRKIGYTGENRHPDKDETQDQVHQFRGASPTGEEGPDCSF